MRYWKIIVELPNENHTLLYAGEFTDNHSLIKTMSNIIEQHHKDNVDIVNQIDVNNSNYEYKGDFEVITQFEFNKLSKSHKIIKQ